jgi:hypothetical protein
MNIGGVPGSGGSTVKAFKLGILVGFVVSGVYSLPLVHPRGEATRRHRYHRAVQKS